MQRPLVAGCGCAAQWVLMRAVNGAVDCHVWQIVQDECGRVSATECYAYHDVLTRKHRVVVSLLQAAGWVGGPPGAVDPVRWAAGGQAWVGAWAAAAWAWAAGALAAPWAAAWAALHAAALGVLAAAWVAGARALHLPPHPLCLMRTTTLRR